MVTDTGVKFRSQVQVIDDFKPVCLIKMWHTGGQLFEKARHPDAGLAQTRRNLQVWEKESSPARENSKKDPERKIKAERKHQSIGEREGVCFPFQRWRKYWFSRRTLRGSTRRSLVMQSLWSEKVCEIESAKPRWKAHRRNIIFVSPLWKRAQDEIPNNVPHFFNPRHSKEKPNCEHGSSAGSETSIRIISSTVNTTLLFRFYSSAAHWGKIFRYEKDKDHRLTSTWQLDQNYACAEAESLSSEKWIFVTKHYLAIKAKVVKWKHLKVSV